MQQRIFAAAVTLGVAGILSMSSAARGAVIISDDFNAAADTETGFALDTAVNKGINPPSITRLTGTAAEGLRWMNRTGGQKPDTSYLLDNNRLKINSGAQSGRISLSPDGTAAANFGAALGTDLASPLAQLEYDIRITMRNSTSTAQRMSFAWATAESSAGDWDFGVQLYKAASADTTYTVQKRIDMASSGVAADVNAQIGTIANAHNSLVPFLIRVNDAGAESGTDYNSRVRVSVDNGATWIYDTDSDAALPNGFRFDGTSRFLSLDIAGGTSATFFDNLSIDLTTAVPEPGTLGLAATAGMMLVARRRRA